MKLRAYHITWGTYGMRLHGDPRGTVDRKHNTHNMPVLGFDQHRWEREKSNLKFPPVTFTRPEMVLVESPAPAPPVPTTFMKSSRRRTIPKRSVDCSSAGSDRNSPAS